MLSETPGSPHGRGSCPRGTARSRRPRRRRRLDRRRAARLARSAAPRAERDGQLEAAVGVLETRRCARAAAPAGSARSAGGCPSACATASTRPWWSSHASSVSVSFARVDSGPSSSGASTRSASSAPSLRSAASSRSARCSSACTNEPGTTSSASRARASDSDALHPSDLGPERAAAIAERRARPARAVQARGRRGRTPPSGRRACAATASAPMRPASRSEASLARRAPPCASGSAQPAASAAARTSSSSIGSRTSARMSARRRRCVSPACTDCSAA